MHGSVRSTAIMASAGVLLAGAMTTASAASASPPAGRGTDAAKAPVLVDCFSRANVRPQDFILACGDGNSRLASLHWTHWGTRSATAVGLNAVNDCKPYCAAGRFHVYKVTVRLDQPRAWERNTRLEQFSRISVSYLDSRPAGYAQVMTVPLWK